MDFKEYTKLRDIAQKRIKRGQAAGIGIDVNIPTVKELRNYGETAQQIELMRLQQFLETGFSLARRAEQNRVVYTESEKRKRKREQSRFYRRTKVAREYAREDYPTKYVEYLRGIKTLNDKIKKAYRDRPELVKDLLIDIKPKQLPQFFAYMDYRFAQGSKGEKKYVFDIFVDDFQKMLQKGYDHNQILGDFQKFEADQAMIADRAGDMSDMDYEKAQGLWDQFIDNIDED